MIYLDNAATTKPYKEVIDTVAGVMSVYWGNPSSHNSHGDKARVLIENVRQQIADDINASPNEIIFTSGACEANSLALSLDCRHTLTNKLEHASINDNPYCYHNFYDNDKYGFITKKYTNLDGRLVSIALANGEIGTIQDIKTFGDAVHKCGGIIHTDATQLFPEQRIDVKALGIDMMSVSAQKFHGPRGIGFLYVKNGINLKPIIYGSQENSLRGGTYNTAAICGMGKALEITRSKNSSLHVQLLRDKLLSNLLSIPGTHLNGPPIGAHRLVNNISITIDGVNAERLMTLCDLSGVIIAKGSACQSHITTPSHVLKAIGLTDEQALNTIRITLDEYNTEEEIKQATKIITHLIERIRNENDK